MKKSTQNFIIQSLIIFLLTASTILAAFGYDWHPLRIGAGGWLVGMDIAPDGTKVVRADTYGAYLWTATQWQQLVTATSMPAADVAVDNAAGVYEIRIAPNNTNRFYMMYNGNVYRSDNRGTAWAKTAFAPVTGCDANDNYRINGQKMAVDPANPDVVYVGTTLNGVWVTANGGSSWAQVSTVPTGGAGGITGIAFDAGSGTTGGKTNMIYLCSWGNGVYRSTDAGGSFTKATGGPTTVNNAIVAGDGIYYAADGTAAWKYASGAWTNINASGGWHSIAVDPADPARIVVGSDGGNLDQSLDRGATWGGTIWGSTAHPQTRVASDIPWLAWTAESYMSNGNMIFDPSATNKLFFSEGIGVWYTNLSRTQTWDSGVVWNSQSAGIEQLVANEIVSPPAGRPLVASWDRPVFYVADPDSYPSKHGPDNQNAIIAGWALDWASNVPSFIAGLFNWGTTEKSSYSTDHGQTWHAFPSHPANFGNGGSIAAASPDNIVWVPENNMVPYYTKDGGTTWSLVNAPGAAATGETGWGFAYYLNRHIVAADRKIIGTFYLYNYLKGLYKSVDSGSTWTLVHAGEITPWSSYNAELKTVPLHAGHLFFTGGPQGGAGSSHPENEPFMRSTDGGATWTAVPNVLEVRCFGFGVEAGLSAYTTIYICGWVNNVYGIWRSDSLFSAWTQIGDWPLGSIDNIKTISGDMNEYGTVYVGFSGSGYAYGKIAASAAGPSKKKMPVRLDGMNLKINRLPQRDIVEISFSIVTDGQVDISIYNADGRLIRQLVNKDFQAGSYYTKWNGRGERGVVSGGIYFVKMKSSTAELSQKIVLME
ncbi:MAG TPA: T9SS type A sorting domain-containing protein [Chitinivibrionales bacterium]|nr:T9SS type A sorting domain-containing protein [Chitinivibrionales bacterium]